MAQEAPNVLHAAVKFNGATSTILNSRGILDSGFNKVGAGVYTMPLVDPVDPDAVVCSGCAFNDTAPLIFGAVVAPGTPYLLVVSLQNAAGAPTDGNVVQVQVTKFATDD